MKKGACLFIFLVFSFSSAFAAGADEYPAVFGWYPGEDVSFHDAPEGGFSSSSACVAAISDANCNNHPMQTCDGPLVGSAVSDSEVRFSYSPIWYYWYGVSGGPDSERTRLSDYSGSCKRSSSCPYGGTLRESDNMCVNADPCPPDTPRDPSTGQCNVCAPSAGKTFGHTADVSTGLCMLGCQLTSDGYEYGTRNGQTTVVVHHGPFTVTGQMCDGDNFGSPPLSPTDPTDPTDPNKPSDPNGNQNGNPNGDPNGIPNGDPNGDPNGKPNGKPGTGSEDGTCEGDDCDEKEGSCPEWLSWFCEEKEVEDLEPPKAKEFKEGYFTSTFDSILGWQLSEHSGTCPHFSVTLFGKNNDMTIHCDIARDYLPYLKAIMICIWSLVAFRIVMEA